MLGSGASGALNGFEANSTAIFTTASAENGTGWPSGSAARGDEPDGASEAASAPPTARCKNSRRRLSAIVFFIRSTPHRRRAKTARHGVALSQNEKSAAEEEKPALQPRAFRPWRVGCISFFAAQRDAFCLEGEMRPTERGVVAGNRRRQRRYCESAPILRAIRRSRTSLRGPRLD